MKLFEIKLALDAIVSKISKVRYDKVIRSGRLSLFCLYSTFKDTLIRANLYYFSQLGVSRLLILEQSCISLQISKLNLCRDYKLFHKLAKR